MAARGLRNPRKRAVDGRPGAEKPPERVVDGRRMAEKPAKDGRRPETKALGGTLHPLAHMRRTS